MKISRRRLAGYVKTLHQKACSTIIFLHSTNQIIDLWRCRWRCRRQILSSLLRRRRKLDFMTVAYLCSVYIQTYKHPVSWSSKTLLLEYPGKPVKQSSVTFQVIVNGIRDFRISCASIWGWRNRTMEQGVKFASIYRYFFQNMKGEFKSVFSQNPTISINRWTWCLLQNFNIPARLRRSFWPGDYTVDR